MKLNYDLELSKELYSHYINNEIGYSSECKKCKAYNEKHGRILKNGPIPVFHIGDQYKESKIRVLFLGTVAYGWEGEIPNIFIEDKETRKNNVESTIDYIESRISDLFNERKMKFFTYIEDCLKNTKGFENNTLNKIALSNLIKCNMGNDKVRNEHLQKNYDFCIREEHTGNLISDINVLNPTHVIILSRNTHKFWRYKQLIENDSRKVLFVHHPSSSTKGGKTKFIKDVNDFLES